MLYVHLFGKENQNIQNARNKPFQKSYQVFITHHQHNCLSRGMSYTATCFDNCHVVWVTRLQVLTIITYLLTLWNRGLPEKLKRPELRKKFPAFYGTRRFITAFTRARHLSLSWARLTQSMPLPPPSDLSQVHFNIILPPTPRSSKWSPSLRFPH
jgi:hypothetical protein